MKIFRKKRDNDIEILDISGEIKKEVKVEKKANTRNREFVIVSYVMIALFLVLGGYFCYYVGYESENFINNPYNRRLNNLSSYVVRGDIISNDGVLLATTSKDKKSRIYPESRLYAHAIGFATHGTSGLEKDYNFALLRSHSFILERLKNEVVNNRNMGDTVRCTIDSKVQRAAYDGLGVYDGAVIAMDPKTGEIICMISKPDFEPNDIDEKWESISGDNESAVLLNRATQGLYPPGSTFKIITAMEYLREGGSMDDTYVCTGSIKNNDMEIHCYHGTVHGTINFKEAFSVSCNCDFARIGLGLNISSYKRLCESLLFNNSLPTKISNVKKSKFDLNSKSHENLIMQTAFGQGNTLVTPIHMLMIISAIENDGVLVEPRLVNEILNSEGEHVRYVGTDTYGSVMAASEAKAMREYLRAVITDGTNKNLSDTSYTAYGKTGTADYASDEQAHSWFVGFAEYDDRQLAIAVIMEGAGSGSQFAQPLAKKVFDAYFNP